MRNNYITAVYFKVKGERKVVFMANSAVDCQDAAKFSKFLLGSIPPKGSTDARVRTYELGATNHQIDCEI